MYRCISAYSIITVLYLLLPCIIILFLHLLSTNHKRTRPNLLLRRRGWTGILRWGVLGYVLPWLSFLWSYGVLRCSISLRVIIVFRDTIYVIIIVLYLRQLVIYEPFWPYVWNNWSWVMHTMSTWFWCETQVLNVPIACWCCGPGKPSSLPSTEGGFTPTTSMARSGEKLSTDPRIGWPSCTGLCQQPFFSGAVALFIVVDDCV
jgi:hypothetical protein